MKTMCVAGVVVAVLLVASIGLAAESNGLPVTKVTAFSSGVAYFEHNGKVTGDQQVELMFRAEQINDILKSLVALDPKGEVRGVSYTSLEPLSHALKSFGIDVSGNPTLGQILQQIRGSEVVVSTPDRVTGKILSVETKTKQIMPANVVQTQEVLNLFTADGAKAIPLDSITSIALVDEKLNADLNKALALIVQSRDKERKPIQIRFAGKGERDVQVSYITEAPVWRTSYRLVLDDKKKNAALMQGWAIVQNTGEFDWENVQLTLVSGRPVSFIEDLYTPLFVPRPTVVPELYASLRPQTYEEGIEKDGRELRPLEQPRRMAQMGKSRAAAPQAMMDRAGAEYEGREEAAAPAPAPPPGMAEQMQNIRAAATGAGVGELFAYKIKTPVALARSRSAMLPIINQDVKARKISIYNAAVMPGNPLNGLWLTNDTDLSLLGGPVTVFDGNTYAGDAQIGNLSAKDQRLLSYAIDLDVKVDSSQKSAQSIIAAKIARGVLQVTRKYEFTQQYVAKNKAEKPKTLVIEHPRTPDRKLIKPEKAVEETPALYRFEVELPASETGKFDVIEQRTDVQGIAILPVDVGTLIFYARNGEIPQKVKDALGEAISRKNALAVAEQQLMQLEQQVQQARSEQAQVRSNIQVLERGTEPYSRFVKKLGDIETQVEQLQGQIKEKRDEVNRLRKALEDYVGNMNVE